MAGTGSNDVLQDGQPLVTMSPGHAKTVADGGLGKADAKRMLFEKVRLPLHRFSRENIGRRFLVHMKGRCAGQGALPVRMVQRPDDLLMAAFGGAYRIFAQAGSAGSYLRILACEASCT